MTEFEASAEPLQDWLTSTEVRVQESSARLHDLPAKKQELSKLQVFCGPQRILLYFSHHAASFAKSTVALNLVHQDILTHNLGSIFCEIALHYIQCAFQSAFLISLFDVSFISSLHLSKPCHYNIN